MGVSSANNRCGTEYYNVAQFARQFGLMQLIPIPSYLSCNKNFIDRVIVPEKTLEAVRSQFAKDEATFQLRPYPERPEKSLRFEKWWATYVNKYFAKDLGEVLAKVTPEAIVVENVDTANTSKSKKKSSRSEGPSPSVSLKRKGAQEVVKPDPEETPKKKRLKKLSEKKSATENTAVIAGRTRSNTKTSSPDQAESKETTHHAESNPKKEVVKTKTKTAPTKKIQEEEVGKTELKKSLSIASGDSSTASLDATSEGPPINPEHEASSQTPDKSRVSPFKPDPPTVQKDEVVEEAADEDMEDFFKTAASLVQVSLSGISGDGSSPTQVPPMAEEINEAKETFKALIKMDIRTALHPGRASSFKKALGVLARAQVFSEAAETTLQYFHKDFPDMQKSYDSAALELSKVESSLTEIDDLRQELSKCVGGYETFKSQIEAIEGQKTNLAKDIQTWEDQIQELKKKQEDAEKSMVALVTQQSKGTVRYFQSCYGQASTPGSQSSRPPNLKRKVRGPTHQSCCLLGKPSIKPP